MKKTKKVIRLNTIFRYILLLLALVIFAMILRKNEAEKKQIDVQYPQAEISVLPDNPQQGDPVMITINSSTTPISISYDGVLKDIINYNNKPRVFTAIPLEETDLDKVVKVILSNGVILEKEIRISQREKIEKPLGIPEQLGGNTKVAGKALVDNLSIENNIINNIKASSTTQWSKSFVSPLKNLIVTDAYGYSRNTVGYNITHKGTDFRAATGTEVYAMNTGIVRISKLFTVYGNTVVIDHGNGLSTLYMHLSKLKVKEGDTVQAGQLIGLSGKTGYAEAAHLHVSIKIDGVSIDPARFLGFFNVI